MSSKDVFLILPTFDEWHQYKYQQSFEDRWYIDGAAYDTIFRGMCSDMRDYITEICQSKNTGGGE